MQSLFIYCFIFFSSLLCADSPVGFWKSINDETHKAESIVAIYEYNGKYFGRIVATYDDKGNIQDSIDNPVERAPGVQEEPFYSGMDIIWNLEPKGSSFTKGKILDPEKGRVYDAEMWINYNGNLIVRGQIWVFGKNQEWLPAKDSDFPPNFQKPDLTQLTPSIPKVKKQPPIRTRGSRG